MIQKFVDKFMASDVRGAIKATPPSDYEDILKIVLGFFDEDERSDECPDKERIHTIDDGNYQGTLLFVIAQKGYQPSTYWYTTVDYGSCSGCDTLQAIQGYNDDPLDDEQIESYWTLALHMVQQLKEM